VRFLLDANLSPQLLSGLRDAGHEAVHVVDLGLVAATDQEIFDRAAHDGYVVITADSDFTILLAARASGRPSVVLLRQVAELRWQAHQALIVANLSSVLADLEAGAVVSLSPTRLAVRRLPIR